VRILLDECLPAELADELTGHEVRTVQQAGWSSVDNGALLQRAATKFDIFITIDKHIQRNHTLPGTLAVITIRARANRIQSLRPLVPELLRAIERVRPGAFERVGA
jgi:predicted nuclease of predicted toxin-antitoxin system